MQMLTNAIDFTVDHDGIGECAVALFRTPSTREGFWQAEIDLSDGRSFATHIYGDVTLSILHDEIAEFIRNSES